MTQLPTKVTGQGETMISIIIPAHNAEKTLGSQVEALLAQRCHVPWQIVVVDNNSGDATAEIAISLDSAEIPVRVVKAADGLGPAYARNAGVAATSTPWIAFCDADDVVAEGWLASIAAALEDHEFVSGPLELGRLNPPWLVGSRGRRFSNARTSFEEIFPYASSCNMAITRALFEQVGGFDESLSVGEDIDLSLRIWQRGTDLHFEPGALVHYRLRDQLGELFRQSRQYGAAHPLILERLRSAGHDVSSRTHGARRWVWLLRNLPLLRTHAGKARWLWVAGGQIGRIQGGLRVRRLYI